MGEKEAGLKLNMRAEWGNIFRSECQSEVQFLLILKVVRTCLTGIDIWSRHCNTCCKQHSLDSKEL